MLLTWIESPIQALCCPSDLKYLFFQKKYFFFIFSLHFKEDGDKKLFQVFDTDGNGTVEIKELHTQLGLKMDALMERIGEKWSQSVSNKSDDSRTKMSLEGNVIKFHYRQN